MIDIKLTVKSEKPDKLLENLWQKHRFEEFGGNEAYKYVFDKLLGYFKGLRGQNVSDDQKEMNIKINELIRWIVNTPISVSPGAIIDYGKNIFDGLSEIENGNMTIYEAVVKAANVAIRKVIDDGIIQKAINDNLIKVDEINDWVKSIDYNIKIDEIKLDRSSKSIEIPIVLTLGKIQIYPNAWDKAINESGSDEHPESYLEKAWVGLKQFGADIMLSFDELLGKTTSGVINSALPLTKVTAIKNFINGYLSDNGLGTYIREKWDITPEQLSIRADFSDSALTDDEIKGHMVCNP